MKIPENSRWQSFRSSDDSIPTTHYEAGVFIQNARLYLTTFGYSTMGARMELNDAHERVNKAYRDSLMQEVA